MDHRLNIFSLLLFFLSLTALPLYAENDTSASLTKEQKLVIVNTTGLCVITVWGITNWDYGERSPSASSEGWFGQNTKEGGADKAGHFYTSYVLTHSFAYLYKSWGYTLDKAPLYGALSSYGIVSFMEIGDSFSNYGFSYEDMIMNTFGCYTGYLLYKHPSIADKIDIRLEYIPDFGKKDPSTDYENMKFLLAFKLDGFKSVTNRFIKLFEVHLGYYARGYSNDYEENRRYAYLGIGLNLSRLFNKASWKRTSSFLNYYQPPYTYLEFKRKLQN